MRSMMRITAVETGLANVVADHSETRRRNRQPPWKELAAGTPLIEQIFYLQDFKDIRFPERQSCCTFRTARREAGPSPLGHRAIPPNFQAAQRLEFQQKNFPAALAAYRQALKRANDPRRVGMILNAVARVQRKSGLLKEAVSTYENIVLEHGRVVIPEGVPLGPSAALEICALSRSSRTSRSPSRRPSDSIDPFSVAEWTLERSEFEFFVQRARSHHRGILFESAARRRPRLFE